MYDRSGKVVDRRELLKIKLKSLAAEAKIIRKEEKKVGTIRYVEVVHMDPKGGGVTKRSKWKRVRMGVNPLAYDMWAHRTKFLREESRLTGIAYGLIRGRTLEKLEGNCNKSLTEAQWDRIYAMMKKYGAADMVMPERKAA